MHNTRLIISFRYFGRTKHYVVLGVSIQIFGTSTGWKDLEVSTSTVYTLLMLNSELNHKCFSFIVEWLLELRRDGVELGILTGLNTYNSTAATLCINPIH